MSVTDAGTHEQATHPASRPPRNERPGWAPDRDFPADKDARSGWDGGVQRAIPLSGARGNGRKAGLRGSITGAVMGEIVG